MDSASSSSSAFQSSSSVIAEFAERERTNFVVGKSSQYFWNEGGEKHRLKDRAKRSAETEEKGEARLSRKHELRSD